MSAASFGEPKWQEYMNQYLINIENNNYTCLQNFKRGLGFGVLDFDIAAKFAGLLGGMGLALITTFYGVLLSNLVFLPIGGKLKRRSEEELMLRNIIVEGIMSIHAREHPILIQEKLMTFVQESKWPN